jgi:D-alanine-D-alanine ligase
MAKKTTVALLFGGRSAEHEVSIRSAASIYNHLDKDRYKTVSLFLDKSGRWKQVASPLLPPGELRQGRAYPFLPWGMGGFTAAVKADIYFPVLHGPYGEDGTIQGLLELADVPFVGAGVLASAAGMDKAVMKILFQASGLRVAPCRVVLDSEWASRREEVLRRLNREMVPPLFVKPANLGSSVGISKVGSMDRLEEALELAFRYDRKVLVEKGLEAREIECAVLGNDAPEASLPGEVMPAGEFYDYKDKYLDGKTQFGIPANLPPATVEEVRRQAVAAFQACGCDGLTRVDFLLEKSTGLLYVNEVNTLPGFTEISMYPKLWEVSGMSFDRLVDRLIELGFERHARKKRCTESGAG